MLKRVTTLPPAAPRALERARCARCHQDERFACLVRLTVGGRREWRCFDCYLLATGGVWRPDDHYWDGDAWIPLRRGE